LRQWYVIIWTQMRCLAPGAQNQAQSAQNKADQYAPKISAAAALARVL